MRTHTKPAAQLTNSTKSAPETVGCRCQNQGEEAPPPSVLWEVLFDVLCRAGIAPQEWPELRPHCRIGVRETRFSSPAYRFVALILPGGEAVNVTVGPNDVPGAAAWWSRRLGVAIEDEGADLAALNSS